jgi:hypothetical protein
MAVFSDTSANIQGYPVSESKHLKILPVPKEGHFAFGTAGLFPLLLLLAAHWVVGEIQ